jgi:hypothetical protein
VPTNWQGTVTGEQGPIPAQLQFKTKQERILDYSAGYCTLAAQRVASLQFPPFPKFNFATGVPCCAVKCCGRVLRCDNRGCVQAMAVPCSRTKLGGT